MSTFSNINISIGKVINTVSTIADLRNYKPRSIHDGDTVIVSAGAILGDSNGGTFVWVEGSTVADDGADTIRPVFSVGSGRWVKAFGKGERGIQGPRGQGSGADVGTFDEARTQIINNDTMRIRTSGRATAGDGGSATYDRTQATLPGSGQNIWWFVDASGGRWVLADNQTYYAAMFGATGGTTIDAAPILNAAFDAPMVDGINLGAKTHYFTPSIDVPSGKFLRGISRSASWLKVLPLAAGSSQSSPRFAVRHVNDTDGNSQDYSLDCQRSGLGRGDTNRTHGVCIIAASGGTCSGTRVRRIDVYNTWGYAMYTTAGLPNANGKVRNVSHEDCRVFNFQVGFETTGNVDASWSRDTLADSAPQDGGSAIPTEALYHEYGAMQGYTRYAARGRGKAAAGILVFTTDGVDMQSLTYDHPDIVMTGDTALYVEGRDGNRINNFNVIGGSVTGSILGALFRNANAIIRDTKIVGLNGPGLEGGTGAVIDFYSPDIEGNSDPAGTTGAYGVSAQGALMKWHGAGRLAAFGPPAESYPTGEGGIAFPTGPDFIPAPSSNDDGVVVGKLITDKMFVVPRSAWLQDSPNVPEVGDKNFYVKLDLTSIREGGVRNQGKSVLTVQPLEFPFPNGSVNNPDYTMTVLWIDNTQVRVYIDTKGEMTGWVIKIRLAEYE